VADESRIFFEKMMISFLLTVSCQFLHSKINIDLYPPPESIVRNKSISWGTPPTLIRFFRSNCISLSRKIEESE
jgi:hypothetical protein